MKLTETFHLYSWQLLKHSAINKHIKARNSEFVYFLLKLSCRWLDLTTPTLFGHSKLGQIYISTKACSFYPVNRRSPATCWQTKSWQTKSRKHHLSSPTVDLQASQKVSSVNLSMRLVLPTPREPIIIICSLKSAGLGGIFLRRDWAPKAGDEFSDPLPLPAALCGMSYLGSISISTFDTLTGGNKILNKKWISCYCQLTLVCRGVWESLSLSCCCSAISRETQNDVTNYAWTSVSAESPAFI